MNRRRRLSMWVLVALAVVVNFPVANHLWTQRSIDANGVVVDASLVDAAQAGEGSDTDYGLAFRFDEAIDPAQTIWTSEVDRPTFQRALETQSVEVRVLADRPSAYRVSGAVTTRLGWYFTAILDAALLAGWLFVRRRARQDTDRASRPGHRAAPLLTEAIEDVQKHEPHFGPPANLEELGGETYLVVGEVAVIEPDAVVLELGGRRVHVALGPHVNRVGFQQPGRVRVRLTGAHPVDLPGRLPD